VLEEIHKKIFDIWDTKFKILELNSKKTKSYNLYHDISKLDIYKVYITSLFKILWDYPESIFYILKNSDISNFKEDLSDFIVNSLFCNNISVNYMENNLLYVITMMLKKEIDDLKSKGEIAFFLEETKTAFLLEQMVKMPDVQIYFRKIIFKMVEKVENYGSLKKINFNTDIIMREIIFFIEEENKKSGKKEKKTIEELILKYISTKILEQSMNAQEEDDELDEKTKIKNNIKLDENFKKYEKNITVTELENLKKEAEKNNKKDLIEYYEELIKYINLRNCPDLYKNNFINKYNNQNGINKDYLLFIYQKDFLNVISFLEIFINDLLMNISSIPNSIKYICKIISILVKKKFNDISKFGENSFLSKFFLEKLLLPILKSPSTNVLLNDFVISETTQYNLVTIGIILKYVFQGQLFRNNFVLQNEEEENYYTFFNQFILEQNEKIIYFFQKIVDTSLPPFIDKYLNNSLPSDYLYDYFTENPGQMYVSISICFKLRNLIAIVRGLQNSENDLFNMQNNKVTRLKKIYNKFKTEEKINELKLYDLNQIVVQRFDIKNNNDCRKSFSFSKKNSLEKSENYYIINEYEIEKKFQHLFQVQNKMEGFYIDIKKLEKKGKLEEKEKNIIKFKNYLINSLMNYSVLNRSSITKTKSVLSIFTQIHKYMSLPNYILNDNGIIPANWSISSVLEYMKKIPEEYKENDYQKFFVELTQNLEDSISEFDFETIFMFKKRIQFLDKRQQYYTNYLKVLEDINYNGVVKDFVEKFFCPIEVRFCYDDDDEKIFELKKSNINKKVFKDLDIIQNAKNEKIIFKTVSSFVRYFPDLNKYQDKKDINPLQIIEELSINKKIFDYFELIKNNFIHERICDEEEYDKIYDEKIKNYIMNKIYKKIYPCELEYEDSKLFEKTMHLSWVEPNMIIPGDTSLDALDNILPDILEEFKKLNKANSPYTKLKCIKKIFEYIGVIVKFNDGGEGDNREVGAEDITPYLNYVLIRACPVRIFSDIKFIKYFLKDGGKLEYDFLNVEMMCKNILNSTYKNFHISESEYIKKCNEAIINNKINSDKRFNEIIDRFEITNN
jgi:hypothetical protein